MVDEKYDVAIVGGGLGGLAAGATLAKSGKKVILVEQHRVVGGAAQIFRRGKRKFEVGLHEMNAAHSGRNQHMFKKMGIQDKVEFIRVPEFYRIKRGDLDIVMPDNIQEAEKMLKEKFPNNANEIEKYFSDMIMIRNEFENLRKLSPSAIVKLLLQPFKVMKILKFRKSNVGDYFDNLTDNEDLKLSLIANFGYYHDDPYSLSLLLFIYAQSTYMTGGGFFVKGGSQELSNAMADVITENAGKVILRHTVNQILVKNRLATGIKYISTSGRIKTEFTINADHIVLNAPLPIVDKLIPSLKNSKEVAKINKYTLPCSLSTIYLSFKKPVNDIFDGKYSTFILHQETDNLGKITTSERSDQYNKKGIVFVDYSSVDSGLGTDNNSIGAICFIDYMKYWKDLDEEEYTSKKSEITETLLSRVESQFPGFRDRIEYTEMSTPKTIERYTQNPHGVIYGFAQTPKQALRNRTRLLKKQVKNLYISSAYAMVGGFGGTISQGYRVGKSILKIKH